MEYITKLLAFGLLLWFGLLALLIAVRILRRDIEVAGFLANSAAPGKDQVLPERVLAMAAFPAILITYVITALHADVSGANPSLPNVPDVLITILTGSNSLYLAGKIARSQGGAS